jgi:hypothetical protein
LYEDLLGRVGGPTTEETVWSEAGPLAIEVRFEWGEAREGAIRIRATANGPSWWRLERLEETALVPPPSAER